LKKLELYERYSFRHPSYHHIRSEQVEVESMDMSKVEGMDMPEVECMDMVEDQNHSTNHRLGEEGMNMVSSNMVEVEVMDAVEGYFHPMNHRPKVEGMNMMEEQFRSMNHRLKVEGMDTVEEHFHPMNLRPKVDGIDTVDTGIWEDRAAELKVVEREPEGAVLTRHWIGDGVARHRRTHWKWEKLAKSGCLKDHPTFATQDFNYNSP
jgi:hypothetical protein